jgi:K+-sensing histidine kinase KdpD
MADLLETVSDLRKLELGTLQVDSNELDLVALVRDTVTDTAGQLGDRSVTVVVPDEALVFADPVRARQVLTNLVSNAAKFTASSATVAIEVVIEDHHVELSVSDDGPGIALDRHGELFESSPAWGARCTAPGSGSNSPERWPGPRAATSCSPSRHGAAGSCCASGVHPPHESRLTN